MRYFGTTIASPVGRLRLVAREGCLAAILWDGDDPKRVRLGAQVEDPAHSCLVQTARELGAYFAGQRTVFTVPLDLAGTAFQRLVWQALCDIPFGATRSYGDIARAIGRPTAFRAVGAANGRNPVSIIVPCHRAIGTNGALTGFAGGLASKRYLLTLEAAPLHVAA